jgi:hypothetical protein
MSSDPSRDFFSIPFGLGACEVPGNQSPTLAQMQGQPHLDGVIE